MQLSRHRLILTSCWCYMLCRLVSNNNNKNKYTQSKSVVIIIIIKHKLAQHVAPTRSKGADITFAANKDRVASA